jgi:hypothetical protein
MQSLASSFLLDLKLDLKQRAGIVSFAELCPPRARSISTLTLNWALARREVIEFGSGCLQNHLIWACISLLKSILLGRENWVSGSLIFQGPNIDSVQEGSR